MIVRRSLALFLIMLIPACSADERDFEVRRVAHAAGGIDGETYTNSYDALDLNLHKGFTYFEIDFSFTADGQLVCIHDWKGSFRRSFGLGPTTRPNLSTFESLVRDRSKYRKCTLRGLAEWMEHNPSAVLVTDVKGKNLTALKRISEQIPDFRTRVIPQIYGPKGFEPVRNIGYGPIIWTLYRFKGDNEDVLAWTERFTAPFAVTMPKSRARTSLPKVLAERGVPTYVHTLNDPAAAKEFMERFGVTEIYTDFLSPEAP